MKKLLLLPLIAINLLATAQTTSIPDVFFENALINLGLDNVIDGGVLTANISGITSLNVNTENISDLTGIEDFTALTFLNCQDNLLTNLDITQNTSLTDLRCQGNFLISLDVTQNTSLTALYCYKNQLTSLDVSQNTALEVLACYRNQLISLNVSNNTALTTLSCSENQITSIDVSQNASLTTLYCSDNQLTSLDLSQNTALIWLLCDDNQLTCLNVKNGNNSNFISFPSIDSFDATQNQNLTCIEVDDVLWSTLNWTNIDPQTSFSTNCANPCLVCVDTTINDTLIYYVANPAFSSISPISYLDSVQLLTTIIGGCDSIINHYSEFVFNPSFCTDTTEVFDTTFVTVTDTNWVNDTTFVQDTTFVTVTDTNYVTINDTVTHHDTILVSVTDTLIIDVTLTGVPPPNNTNTLSVYPNPANDQLYIDNGDYLSMSGYTLKIVNSVGQDVFNSLITIPLFVIDISTLGSTGLYFIQVIDGSNNVLENKKLVLE